MLIQSIKTMNGGRIELHTSQSYFPYRIMGIDNAGKMTYSLPIDVPDDQSAVDQLLDLVSAEQPELI